MVAVRAASSPPTEIGRQHHRHTPTRKKTRVCSFGDSGVFDTEPWGRWETRVLVPVLSLASDLTLGKTLGPLVPSEVTVSGIY